MPKFPSDPEPILATMAASFRRIGDVRLLDVLEQAEAELYVHDETHYRTQYGLTLIVPHEVFATIEDELDGVEDALREKAMTATRNCSNGTLTQLSVAPKFDGIEAWRRGARALSVNAQDADRIWKPGWFRLFLSHVSLHKREVALLKASLESYHISAFVAHEDIEPSREWQAEIERGLASCHAVAALITPEFHDSIYFMQEVGWGLGRGVLVQPVLLPNDPKGFYAFRQGIRGNLTMLGSTAVDLVRVLSRHPLSSQPMIEALTSALEEAWSWEMARAVAGIIRDLTGFSEDQVRRLLKSIDVNKKVKTGNGVPEVVRELATRHNVRPLATVPSADEYDPFADE